MVKDIDLRNRDETAAYIRRIEYNWKAAQETLHQEQKMWEKEKADFLANDKHCRELCEKILAKDRREAKLGYEYSWSNLSIRELCMKASEFFDKYNSDRSAAMFQVQSRYEEALKRIDELEAQISALQDENLEISSQGVALIIEEGKDFTDDEGRIVNIAETIKMCEEYKVSSSSIPTYESSEKSKLLKEHRTKEYLASLEIVANLEGKLTPDMWIVIEKMGRRGVSKTTDIIKECGLAGVAEKNTRKCLDTLEGLNIVECQKLTAAFPSAFSIYKLTDNCGKQIFENHFQTRVRESEWEKIVKEHDNVFHGYGIMQIADLLRASKKFVNVTEFNRDKPISIDDGAGFFVPDIILEAGNKAKLYIEYETGNSNSRDIALKLTKMSQCASYIMIIVKSQAAILSKYNTVAEKWVKANPQWANLDKKGLYITTPTYMKDNIKSDKFNDMFKYRYDFAMGRIIERPVK